MSNVTEKDLQFVTINKNLSELKQSIAKASAKKNLRKYIRNNLCRDITKIGFLALQKRDVLGEVLFHLMEIDQEFD